MELDVNIGGHDLAPILNIVSHEECRPHCQATPGCTAWTWVPWEVCALKGEGGAEAAWKASERGSLFVRRLQENLIGPLTKMGGPQRELAGLKESW